MAFEVINDRGIPLAAYEILEGKILGLLDKIEVDAYVVEYEFTFRIMVREKDSSLW